MDTRNKRASALGFALAALVVLPAPDGTVDQPDRQHVAYAYAGITSDVPIPDDPATVHLYGSYAGPVALVAVYSDAVDLVGSYGPRVTLYGSSD